MNIDLIGRICRDEYGELDVDNIQLYTKNQLVNEYVKIDYLDIDEVNETGIENIEAMELEEVAEMNDEYLVFTEYHDDSKCSIFLDKATNNLDEIIQKINGINIRFKLQSGNILNIQGDDLHEVRHILDKLNVVYDVVSLNSLDN